MMQDSSVNTSNITLDDKPEKKAFFSKAMLHNGISNIRENLKLMIVLFVLHLSAAPLTLAMLMSNILMNGDDDVETYLVIAVFTTGAAVAAGILCALTAMPYLYKKQVVDMRLSLPMTTAQRFVSDFISGLGIYMLPFFASQVFTWIIMLAGHAVCDGKTFVRNEFYEVYNSNLNIADYTWECHLFEEIGPVLIKCVIGGIAIMLMFYVFTVLVSSCCGSVFECVSYTLMANVVVPLAIVIIIYAFSEGVYGLTGDFYLATLLPYTSPAGGVFGLIATIGESYIDAGENQIPMALTYGKWLAGFLAVTAVMTAGAYLIYRKRRAEDTGKPIVFGIFYHIVMTLAIVCISYMFMWQDRTMITPMIIITAIVYMVFSVIRSRGFSKGFFKSIISYVITMAVCIGSYFLVSSTEMFGAGKYVPDNDDIAEAYISYDGYFGTGAYYSYDAFSSYYNDYVPKITSPENLAVVTEAHRACIEDNGEGLAALDSRDYKVLYKLKSGRYVLREYQMTDEVKEILSVIDNTEEFKAYRAQKVKYMLAAGKENMEYYLENDRYDRAYISVAPQWVYVFYDSIHISELPSDFFEKIGECLSSDIMKETEEQYYRSDGGLWFVEIPGCDKIVIREHYTDTIAYLYECGFTELPEADEDTYRAFFAQEMDMSMVSTELMEYMTGKEVKSSTETHEAVRGRLEVDLEYTDAMYIREYVKIRAYSSEYDEVMSAAVKQYKTDENCYTITVNGNTAVIPASCAETAERLYIMSAAEEFMRRKLSMNYYSDKYYESEGYYESEIYQDGYVYYEDYYPDEYDTSLTAQNIYKHFLKAFLEYYGEEKITAAAGSIYEDMLEYAYS